MARVEGSFLADAEAARVVSQHREEIQTAWLTRLNELRGTENGHKIDGLVRDSSAEPDLFSVFMRQISDRVDDGEIELKPVLDKVRSKDYSLDDLHREMACLEDAAEDVLKRSHDVADIQVLGAMNLVRKSLSAYARAIMRETSAIYEKIVERGARGLCLFDNQGIITFASERMNRLLGAPSAIGESFDSFLGENELLPMSAAVLSLAEGEMMLRKLTLRQKGGAILTIGAEVAPLYAQGRRRGGYLCAVDLTTYEQNNRIILEKHPLGIIKLTIENGAFTYMNPAALEMLGIGHYEGKTIRDVFPDEENYGKVRAELDKRHAFESEEYEVEGTRWTDGVTVPLRITAMPELDPQGKLVGSLAFVRDVTSEKITEKINEYMSRTNDYRMYLESTAKEIARFVPFHYLIVSLYNEEMTHLREFYSYQATGQVKLEVRWWEISEPLRELTRVQTVSRVSDYDAFLDQEAYRHWRDLPEFKFLRKEDFKSSMRLPITRDNRVIAAVSFLSKNKNIYSDKHQRLIEAVPLEKTVLAAIHEEERETQKYRFDLISKIVKERDAVQKVAEALVDELKKQLPWTHFALYKVDKKSRKCILLYQQPCGEAAFLSKSYTQEMDVGILGRVIKTKKPCRIDNTESAPDYVPAFPGMKSECCLPIFIGNMGNWLLNIEDSKSSAFSEMDVRNLEEMLEEITMVLDLIWTRHFLSKTLESTSDMIFVADSNGCIYQPNRKATAQLDYTPDELKKGGLKAIFAPPEAADVVLNSTGISYKEFNLRRKDGSYLPVALSTSELPEEIGGTVIVCRDLSLFRRMVELEDLKKMYNEVAIQTQTPLTLATGWIQDLQQGTSDELVRDTLDKALRQLKKVEITYTRLALQDKELKDHKTLVSIAGIIKRVESAFPRSEIDRMEFIMQEKLPYLRGDLFKLTFCIETILSYLLRYLPPDKKIIVNIFREGEGVLTRITGFLPGPEMEGSVDRGVGSLPENDPGHPENAVTMMRAISTTLVQMALGGDIIKKYVNTLGGTYGCSIYKDHEATFNIWLPMPREENET